MPVTLSDTQWARLVALVSGTTNAFAAETAASSMIAGALGEVAEILVEGNKQLADQQAKPNRATRRKK